MALGLRFVEVEEFEVQDSVVRSSGFKSFRCRASDFTVGTRNEVIRPLTNDRCSSRTDSLFFRNPCLPIPDP